MYIYVTIMASRLSSILVPKTISFLYGGVVCKRTSGPMPEVLFS